MAGKERHEGRQGKVQKQARKGTKVGKDRFKSNRQGKVQKQLRKDTKAGKEQLRKGTQQVRKGTQVLVGNEKDKKRRQ